MPVKDGVPYLEECLTSLLKQDFAEIGTFEVKGQFCSAYCVCIRDLWALFFFFFYGVVATCALVERNNRFTFSGMRLQRW